MLNELSLFFITVINIAAFSVCVYDKGAAKRGGKRVPEKTLLTLTALFGSFGMLVGMYTARHKTKHLRFVISVPLFAVIHAVILILYF